MLGNIWLTSAFVVTTIFSASVAYKSYSDIQDAKHIQESFEIILEVKEAIAKQYGKNQEDITRDEIIAYLPKGPNWEKVLLTSRYTKDSMDTNALLDENGDFILDENDKIKLLALKAKIKKYGLENSMLNENGKNKFSISSINQSSLNEDEIISKKIDKTIEIMYLKKDTVLREFDLIIDKQTPYDAIYHNMKKSSEISVTPTLMKQRKKEYFKKRIKEKLLLSKNSKDMSLYNILKDKL